MAEQSVQIFADINNMSTIASDLINIETNNGYVIINFLQTFPITNAMPNIPEGMPKPQRSAKIVSRISLSWEHFASLIPYFISTLKEMEPTNTEEYNKTKKLLESLQIKEDNNNGKE